MATYTDNYKLKKPAPEDFADVADLNENADKIDAALKDKADLDESLLYPDFADRRGRRRCKPPRRRQSPFGTASRYGLYPHFSKGRSGRRCESGL